jgi:Mn-dependent DtxR family transcriptional regulator
MPRVPQREAQRRALEAFYRFIQAHGRAPSIRELSKELGLKPLSVQGTLNRLIDRGFILAKVRLSKKARAISAAGLRWLEANQEE